jgi:cytosine/adenosine deaminase-related metal-dependent hydrolase
VIDARDFLVLPGFVNAHYHSHDVLAKGTLKEVPLETWRLYAMPQFRRDFAVISQRVAKLRPFLDRAHRQIMTAELDIERLPFGGN